MSKKNDETPKTVFVAKVGSKYTNRRNGDVIKVLSYDEKTKLYDCKLPDGKTAQWKAGYLKLAFLPGKVKIDVAEKKEKKEKKAPKLNKRTYICRQLAKGGKIDSIIEKVGEEFPDASVKDNPLYVNRYAKAIVDFGGGKMEKGKFIPFEITVPE